MRKLLSCFAALAAVRGGAGGRPITKRSSPARLAGRVAGEPVQCIDLHRVRSSQVINDTAIIYDAGSVLYVNRPGNGADSLDRNDTMVTRLLYDPAVQHRHGDDGRPGFGDADRDRLPRRFRPLPPRRGPLAVGVAWRRSCRRGAARAAQFVDAHRFCARTLPRVGAFRPAHRAGPATGY